MTGDNLALAQTDPAFFQVMAEQSVGTAPTTNIGQSFSQSVVPTADNVNAAPNTAPQKTINPELIEQCHGASQLEGMGPAVSSGDTLFGAFCAEMTETVQQIGRQAANSPDAPSRETNVPVQRVGDTAEVDSQQYAHQQQAFNNISSGPSNSFG